MAWAAASQRANDGWSGGDELGITRAGEGGCGMEYDDVDGVEDGCGTRTDDMVILGVSRPPQNSFGGNSGLCPVATERGQFKHCVWLRHG